MLLKLEYPAAPEFAEKHAAIIVQAMKEMEGKDLDYSLDSISHFDQLLTKFHSQGVGTDQVPSILFRIGCYVGEVLVRLHPAAWVDPKKFLPPDSAKFFPFMVLRFPDGFIWNPIGKAFSVLESPETDNLEFSARAQAEQQSSRRP